MADTIEVRTDDLADLFHEPGRASTGSRTSSAWASSTTALHTPPSEPARAVLAERYADVVEWTRAGSVPRIRFLPYA